jgi:hypothetical protein
MDTKIIASFRWLSKDGKLLLVARTLRTFAYGFMSVILAREKRFRCKCFIQKPIGIDELAKLIRKELDS